MRSPAVQLDDLPRAGPMAIDLKSFLTHNDPVVEARTGQPMAPQEWEELGLEGTANVPDRQSFDTGQRRSDPRNPAPSRMALNQVWQ
jgi:hypothetical protein